MTHQMNTTGRRIVARAGYVSHKLAFSGTGPNLE